jgi:TatD DNase family protein
MMLPSPGDYIDIHNHGAGSKTGVFQIENLMTHENRKPDFETGLAYSTGIHPWFLTQNNLEHQLTIVRELSLHENIIALGETGFDKIKGPDQLLQRKAFEEQIRISEEVSKPLFIHCVRAWDELLEVHKKLRPEQLWIVHGFRGKKELALQLISKGMYLSFWFDFIVRPESSLLIQSLPREKIFLETDGSDIDIRTIYKKVAADLNLSVSNLISIIYSNFSAIFKNKTV